MKLLRALTLAIAASLASTGTSAQIVEQEIQGVFADIIQQGETFGELAEKITFCLTWY